RTGMETGIDLLWEAGKQIVYRLIGHRVFKRREFDPQSVQEISTHLLHLGYIYEFECEKWLALCNTLKAINLVEIDRMPTLEAVTYYFAAILTQAKPLSYLGLAQRYIERGEVALAATGQNDLSYGHGLIVKAACASINGDWESAVHTVNRARTFFSEHGAVRDVDNALGLQVHCEFLMGEWDLCYESAAFVYQSARQRRDLQATLGAFMWMLSQWVRRGEWEQVRAMLDDASEHLAYPHSRSMIIWSGSVMGLAYCYLGEPELALKTAEPALKIVKMKAPISNWLHEPLSALAELYLILWQQGDVACRTSAKSACHALINMSSVFRVSQPCADVWQGLYCFLDKRHHHAGRYWRQALTKARQYRTPYYEALAHAYLAQLDSENSVEKQQHLTAAAQIFENTGAVPGIPAFHSNFQKPPAE
ncbi:MAG TPA: hypothetical protein VJZ27_10510, partial [Aggregatilineales bacterium]|nr:hypothetical protein [Aggregatilineales bacterium]